MPGTPGLPDGDPTRALLLGRMAQQGEAPLAVLPVAATGGTNLSGGSGALAVGPVHLWLAQPQLLGGPSVAAVPLAGVGAVTVSEQRTLRGRVRRVELVVEGRPLRFRTRVELPAAESFARAVADARGTPPR